MTAEKWTIWDRFFKWLSRWFVRRKDFDVAMRDGQDARNEVCDLEADIAQWKQRIIHHGAVTDWLADELKRCVYPDLSVRQLIEVAIKKVEDGK